MYDILHVQYLESLWYVYLGDLFVLEAIGMATLRTGDVYVLTVRVWMFFVMLVLGSVAMSVAVLVTAHTILLLARSVVERMEQRLVCKERERTEDRGAVNRRQQAFEVAQGKGVVESEQRTPDKNTHGRGTNPMVVHNLSYLFVVHHQIPSEAQIFFRFSSAAALAFS